MGSKGSKPRKPSHSQHLPKVGTSIENERELHGEREAVLDQIGLAHRSKATRSIVLAIVVVLVVGSCSASRCSSSSAEWTICSRRWPTNTRSSRRWSTDVAPQTGRDRHAAKAGTSVRFSCISRRLTSSRSRPRGDLDRYTGGFIADDDDGRRTVTVDDAAGRAGRHRARRGREVIRRRWHAARRAARPVRGR